MNFHEALNWLYSTQRFGVKLGLENIRALLNLLGAPDQRTRFLHVAGTNGKGSVCALLDSILRTEGYRTGLFTSPHLIEFQERICIDGIPISSTEIAEGLTLLKGLQITGSPTFFELTTALALWHFSRQNVEIVVWETGLGGRWDATNIVTAPLVSVITSISFDHQEWLGDTLTKIASEKAGILKPGIPSASAPQLPEVALELSRVAQLKQAPLRFVENPWTTSKIGLLGPHQQWNAALAVAVIQESRLPISHDAICQGLANVQWPGRFQMLSNQLIVDGAHNPAAISMLIATWREVFGNQQAHIVFGSLKDKESEKMLFLLSDIAKEFLFVSLENVRSKPSVAHEPPTDVYCRYFEDSGVALHAALKDGELVLVTGSLFLVGEVLAQHKSMSYQVSKQ